MFGFIPAPPAMPPRPIPPIPPPTPIPAIPPPIPIPIPGRMPPANPPPIPIMGFIPPPIPPIIAGFICPPPAIWNIRVYSCASACGSNGVFPAPAAAVIPPAPPNPACCPPKRPAPLWKSPPTASSFG
ncbi:hypothetical protein LshimejAT787_0101050 [Lyophyllum shimeji]|uniref:Uncharacterized protein n=1 Tax=Lyophyllum shimeji TaxID=47721 RepID=A0A9P3UJD9_LYOSH|nr:hypothetical protein LshimejAT787_0101050 [Lyophyllum shimeji]